MKQKYCIELKIFFTFLNKFLQFNRVIKKQYINKINWRVLPVVFLYVFISITHILLIPRLNGPVSQINVSHHSVLRIKQTSAANTSFFLSRMVKYVLDDKRTFLIVSFLSIVCFFLLALSGLYKLKEKALLQNLKLLFDYKYSYLFFCTLRI